MSSRQKRPYSAKSFSMTISTSCPPMLIDGGIFIAWLGNVAHLLTKKHPLVAKPLWQKSPLLQ
jgi:hypothetical protein